MHKMQILIIALPVGIWAALMGGVMGVLLTYYRSGEWRNYGRMVSEMIPAMIFSGAVAENLLPLESWFYCMASGFSIGVITGFAIDYWRVVGRYVVHNAIDKLSRVFTGAPLPPPDFDDFRLPETTPPPEKQPEKLPEAQAETPTPPPILQAVDTPKPPRPIVHKRKRNRKRR